MQQREVVIDLTADLYDVNPADLLALRGAIVLKMGSYGVDPDTTHDYASFIASCEGKSLEWLVEFQQDLAILIQVNDALGVGAVMH